MDTPTNRSTQPPRVQQKYNNSNTYCSTAVVGQPSTQKKKNIHQQPTNPQCVYDNSTTAVQQYSRKYAELCQGWGRVYGGQKTKQNKTKIAAVVRRTTPQSGAGLAVFASPHLSTPRARRVRAQQLMCTAEHITQQHMRWYRVCSCVVQGWMYSSTCVGTGTVQEFPFSYDSPPSRGASDPSPGGKRTTFPARRVGHGTRYSPGTEKGCCVGGTWCHSETAGGRVELETLSCFSGVL